MRKTLLWVAVAVAGAVALPKTSALDTVQLYALDGGTIEFGDLGMFSDTGDYDGKPGKMPAPAFLIRHPKGDLLWDTGLGAVGEKTLPGGIKFSVTQTLAAQLTELGLAPKDVEYVAFSHLHADHTGNAALFPSATWVVSARELGWARGKPTPIGVDPKSLPAHAKLLQNDGDVDLFGDGTVRILRAPGHTPDHRVLILKLARAGTVVLSGDLYHIKESVAARRVPVHNVSRADTLASFDRVTKLIERSRARLVVQHASEDFAALPKFPAFLD